MNMLHCPPPLLAFLHPSPFPVMSQSGQSDQQQQQQRQHAPQQYPRQGVPPCSAGPPSINSSPSSYSLSDPGGDEYAIAANAENTSNMATTIHTAARSGSISSTSSLGGISYYHSPSPLPSYYATTPPTHHRSLYMPSYLNPHSTAAQYAYLPRPRPASRTRSYGRSPSSRSHSRSLSPSPKPSPTAKQASLNALAAGASPPVPFPSSSLGGGGSILYAYQEQQPRPSQQQQSFPQHQLSPSQPVDTLPAPAGGFMARPSVNFPSQSLPFHPALAALRTPSRPGCAERLSQRTANRVIAPYQKGHAHPSSMAPTAAWGDLRVFPQAVLDRIWSHLSYKDLIFLREVSRTARDTVDPQRAHRDDKYVFVREREDRLDEIERHQGTPGRLSSAQQCRALTRAACYFCYKVKPTTEFQVPTAQRHWVTVHTDPMTGKIHYVPIPDPNEEANATPMAPPSGRSSYTTQMEGSYGQFGTHSQQHHTIRGRSATLAEATRIHLRQYCIECGVKYGLHVPGELYKTWANEVISKRDAPGKSVWICECNDLPPRNRIHDSVSDDFCRRCNKRASYR
ncbi:hypothetical protein MAPG_07491 [Magnaporthiopsis poae ATCC 64411]|uniref:F-box domain-containing protein n=1 Tax=Magnaporthiopsis poae (strain ATCC 64411 / 73-15) TaxID=644358 RepID=A0A0C4E4U0_MAGP6|nr:hypothetical protein MAPG_07491 [Magnaporthiopsis poae ATCC 64411]